MSDFGQSSVDNLSDCVLVIERKIQEEKVPNALNVR